MFQLFKKDDVQKVFFEKPIHKTEDEELERVVMGAKSSERAMAWKELGRKTEISAMDIRGQRITGRLMFIPVSILMKYAPKGLSIDANAMAKILLAAGAICETLEVSATLHPNDQLRSMPWSLGHFCLIDALENGLSGATIDEPGYDRDEDTITDDDGRVAISAHICVLLTSTYPQVPSMTLDAATRKKIEDTIVFSLAVAGEENPRVLCGHTSGFVDARLTGMLCQLFHLARNWHGLNPDCRMQIAPNPGTNVDDPDEHEWFIQIIDNKEQELCCLSYVVRSAEEWRFFELMERDMAAIGMPLMLSKYGSH